MAQWTGRSRGSLFGYKIFIFFLKNFHIRLAYFILIFVAAYYFVTANKKGIRFYFKKVHKYSSLKVFFKIYKNFYVFGQVIVDKVAILAGFSNKFTFNFDGEEYLHQMAREKTGGVLIGAHVGNWEVAGQLLERIDTRVNIVMFDGENPVLKSFMDDVLVKKNINIIFIKKDDFSHLYAISDALKNKEIIALHGDRFLPGTNNASVKFFGMDAEFPTGPLYLASKYKVPVTYVSAMKETATHYHFFATPLKQFKYPGNLKNRKNDMKIMIMDYVAELERVVKKYPLQWFNYYQFWKTG